MQDLTSYSHASATHTRMAGFPAACLLHRSAFLLPCTISQCFPIYVSAHCIAVLSCCPVPPLATDSYKTPAHGLSVQVLATSTCSSTRRRRTKRASPSPSTPLTYTTARHRSRPTCPSPAAATRSRCSLPTPCTSRTDRSTGRRSPSPRQSSASRRDAAQGVPLAGLAATTRASRIQEQPGHQVHQVCSCKEGTAYLYSGAQLHTYRISRVSPG